MNAAADFTPDVNPLTVPLHELAEVLVKHLGLHEGRYQVGVGFRLGVGAVPGDASHPPVPAAMVGVESVILSPVPPEFDGPNVVDASVLNPAKPKRSRKRQA